MNLMHVGRYFADSKVPTWRKLIGFGAVAYAFMPIDLIPDFVPVIGWLDDIGVLALFLGAVASDISKHAAKLGSAPVSQPSRSGAARVQVIDAQARTVR